MPCGAGEKADQLKRTAKAQKTDTKVSKAKKEGKVVKNKFKGIRIKKGVRIKVMQLCSTADDSCLHAFSVCGMWHAAHLHTISNWFLIRVAQEASTTR